ncbi:hypothetical protein PASE110613_09000 [Paenibacillus sediminis]|uniref:Mg2+/Co2+ transporter CorB n=1 Tax=Paenibacillus sediminis TaxID=664909 RepID=A0ABS4H781_9BACL|nr:hypothetical protein [Paenibacillus sediminis]MBP1938217.1 Mg2+/Co2+ transporter CorB [Paenibacillus sediminis]
MESRRNRIEKKRLKRQERNKKRFKTAKKVVAKTDKLASKILSGLKW